MRKTFGIFGGTFDPIHIGHLRMALELKQQLKLDEMRLLPCYLPPHRATPGASAEQRVAMLELALQGCAELTMDQRELLREKPSYTYDTLCEFRAELGEQISLCLCMGMDSFVTLDQWHEWRQLIRLAHIVVVERPGYEAPSVGPVADLLRRHRVEVEAIHAAPAGAVIVASPALLPISATAIRAQINAGESPQFLLPDSVWSYIRAQGLYR